MRTARAAAMLVLALGMAACETESDQERAASAVKDARQAVLSGDVRRACATLTPHARQRAMAFRDDFGPQGLRPLPPEQRPQTCEQLARAELGLVPRYPRLATWAPQLRSATIVVKHVGDGRATVQARLQGTTRLGPTFELVKVGDRWLIDDSDVVPVGD